MVAPGIVLAAFAAVYVLLSVARLRSVHFERPTVALAGAGLFLAIGALTPAEAMASVQLDTLFLLAGMMLHVAALGDSGFFPWLAARLVAWSGSPRRLLVAEMVAVAVLSALFLNDTIVILFTPVLVHAARSTRTPVAPFLIGEALAANVGSVATPVGNPQNAYIASVSGIDFLGWAADLLVPTLVSLVIAIAILSAMSWRTLAKPEGHPEPVPVMLDGAQARTSAILLAVTFPALAIGSRAGWPLGLIALVSAGAHLLVVDVRHRVPRRRIIGSVDWGVLLLFVGLFILLEGVQNAGVLERGAELVSTPWRLAGTTFALSNIVSNVPAVLALAPLLEGAPDATWLQLAAVSTLAGNALPLGAAANLLVLESAAGLGERLRFVEFARAGLPVAVVTTVVSVLLLTL